MKKNRRLFGNSPNRKKNLFRCFFLFYCLFLCIPALHAESNRIPKVSLRVNEESFVNVIENLRKQTGYDFIFNSEDINRMKGITLDVKDKSLDGVIRELLESSGLTYTIESNTVIIRKEPSRLTDEKKEVYTITGMVKDEQGNPLPGVTVKLTGTILATATNNKGQFTLQLPLKTGELDFSFVGFKSQRIRFTDDKPLIVTMKEEVSNLDEVTVVAYGTTTRREATGSISVIKTEELEGIPAVSIAGLLQGRVAGMDVTNITGAPGGGGTVVTIRGYNSLEVGQQNRFSDPLWVVDGVPLNSFTSPVTGTNLLSDINPDMIESVQVLKDASSASLYGSRAANGVIILTTKKGKKEQKPNLSINVSQTWSHIPRLPTITIGKAERNLRLQAMMRMYIPYLDQEERIYKYPTSYEDIRKYSNSSLDYFFKTQGDFYNEIFLQDSLNPFYNNATNFFPMYTQTGKVTNANIQSYGGAERMTYGMGLGFYDESGTYKGSGYKRINLNANINVVPTDRLTVDLRFDGSLSNRKRSDPASSIPSIEVVPGNPFYLSSLFPGEGSDLWNQTIERNKGAKETNRSIRIRGTFRVAYDILPGLNISSSGSVDYSLQRKNSFIPSYLSYDKYSTSTGETAINLMALNENLLTYQKTIKDDHKVNLVAGFSYQYDQLESNYGYGKNSPSERIYYVNSNFPKYEYRQSGSFQELVLFKDYLSNMEEKSLVSYFGRLEYAYKRKYLLSLSFRRDGSSVFGQNNQWGSFPAIAAGWTFTEEHFMKPFSSWLDFGKIRASWGRSGKHLDYNYLALGLVVAGTVYQGNGTLEPVWKNGLFNDKLSWEETDQYDFGLDMDFFNYRLSFTFDYYYRYTDKLLMEVGLPSTGGGKYTGYDAQYRNAGAISNEGVEFLVSYKIFNNKDFYWKASLNAARNWNRFEKSYDGKDWGINVIGKPLNGIFTLQSDGFVNQQEELPMYYNSAGIGKYLSSGAYDNTFYMPGDYKLKDINGNGVIDYGDQAYAGSALPLVSGGLVSEFRWKNFDLNLSFSFQLGKHVQNMLESSSLQTSMSQDSWAAPLLLDINKVSFWEKPEDNDADYPLNKLYLSAGIPVTDRMVEKVNWLKMKTLTLGYNIPRKWTGNVGVQQLRLFLSGENLFTISGYSGVDPETVDIRTGIDGGRSYPLARKLTIGLTAKF